MNCWWAAASDWKKTKAWPPTSYRSLAVASERRYSAVVRRWISDLSARGAVEVDFTRPGKPTDRSYLESFNGKLRDECSNVTQFSDVVHALQVIAAWRIDYNEDRPHGALGQLTPKEFAESRQQRSASEAA